MQRPSRIIAAGLLILPKYPAALLMQNSLRNQIANRLAALKSGIELNERIGPEQSRRQRFLDTTVNLLVANINKASNVSRVVINQLSSNLERIHVHRDVRLPSRERRVLPGAIALPGSPSAIPKPQMLLFLDF